MDGGGCDNMKWWLDDVGEVDGDDGGRWDNMKW